MPSNKPIRDAGLEQKLTGHRFERLVICYSDAGGLRRGFQFWIGWLGGAEHGCKCVPVYLGDRLLKVRTGEPLKNPCRKELILVCPPADEVPVRDLGARVFGLLQHNRTEQRGLVLLLTEHATIASCRELGVPSAERWFSLGRFAVSRCADADRRSGRVDYEVRSL